MRDEARQANAIRRPIAVALATVALGLAAASAQASLHLSSVHIRPGRRLTVTGVAGKSCHPGQVMTIVSALFAGATRHTFAGKPAIVATIADNRRYAATITLARTVRAGAFDVIARCGSKQVGHGVVHVT